MTTITPASAFTPAAIAARLRELREIAAITGQRYRSDLDRDEESFALNPDVPRWLWVPHEGGSQLAALVPRGKRWASEVARCCQDVYGRTPTPYLVTPERVTAITWEVATAMIEDIPDSDPVDAASLAHVAGDEWRRAGDALEY